MNKIITLITFLTTINFFAMEQPTNMDVDYWCYPLYYLENNNLKALKTIPRDILDKVRYINGNTLLHNAVLFNRQEIVQFLSDETGLRIVVNKDRLTPRDLAQQSDNPKIREWGRKYKRICEDTSYA